MKAGKFLTTENSIFLVVFIGDRKQYLFNSENEVLGDLIQAFNRYGIESIKRLNEAKGVFNKLSKKEIKTLFSWDTHSIEQLKKTNFIK